MNTKVPKRYFFVPFIYLILIALFLYLHLFSFDTVTERVGSATIEVKNGGKSVQSVLVSIPPLSFLFSKKTPLLFEGGDGTNESIDIRGYTLLPDGVELLFSGDLRLRISSDDQGRRTSFRFSSSSQLYNNAVLHLPYNLEEDTEWITAGQIPVLSLEKEGDYSMLSSSYGCIIEPENFLIQLTPVEGGFPELALLAVDEDNRDPLTFWFSRDALKVEKQEYEAHITEYIDDAYRGWRQNRYEQFSEELLNAFLAEAALRGEYEQMLLRTSDGVNARRSELTHVTASFFGNLPEAYRQLQAYNDERVKTLIALTKEGDFGIFNTPGLILFAMNHGPFSLVEEIHQLARIAECGGTDHSICLGLVQTFMDGSPLLTEDEDHLDYETIIEEGVLPWITKTEEGLFLEISRGIVDSFTSLRAGIILIQAGETVNNDIFVSIGRYLVISALSLSDGQGFLPEKLVIQNGVITEQHDTISPESVYPLLKKNPYYQHEISLHKEIAPGAWVLTSADIHSIDINNRAAVIDLSFPEGMSHHMIIQGIPPFARMQLYGINWVSDPSFEAYSSGWAYDAASETLFIKLQHRQERETVRIFFTE